MEPMPRSLGRRGYQPVVRRNVDEGVAEGALFGYDGTNAGEFNLGYWSLIKGLEGVQGVTFRKLRWKYREPVQVGTEGFLRKKPLYEYRSLEEPIELSSILEKHTTDELAGIFQYDARDMAGYDGRLGTSFTYSIFIGERDFENVVPEVMEDPHIIPDTGRELFPNWFDYLKKKARLKEPIHIVRTLGDAKLIGHL